VNAIIDDGVYQTRQILRKADKASVLALDKANREAAKPTIDYAKKITPDVPLSQWAKYGWSRRGSGQGELDWDKTAIFEGYKFLAGKKSKATGVRTILRFVNKSAAGSIFEVAGRGKSQGKTPQGKAFVQSLNRAFPRRSRLLWQAVDDFGNDELRAKIIDNYNKLIDEYNAKLSVRSYAGGKAYLRRIGG
jgi:hypothetical protein